MDQNGGRVTARVEDIMDALGALFPWELAAPGDGGLLLGSPESELDRVICSLDLDLGVVRRAASSRCGALVVHHAHPLTLTGSPSGRDEAVESIEREAGAARVSVIGCHANADRAAGGTADAMAAAAGLKRVSPLEPAEGVYVSKLVVFVPPGAVDAVFDAMAGAGAGVIGRYTHCGFRSRGKGSFLPGHGTVPHSGAPGRLSVEEEVRLEMVVPSFRASRVIEAMLAAHPYEEAAYDLYRTENPVPWGNGRIGDLPASTPIRKLAAAFATWCEADRPALDCGVESEAERVAVAPGDGGPLFSRALASGAQLFVTGEMDGPGVSESVENGMAVLRLGHAESEKHLVRIMIEGLERECAARGLSVTVEG